MKHFAYLFTLATLMATASFAQLHTGMVSSVVLAKPAILGDVNLHTSFAKNSIQVSWQATLQAQVRRYELEKSIDGTNFFYLTSFAGTEKKYSTEDNYLSSSVAYYRLKIIETGGNILYSAVETIHTKKSAEAIRILPTRLDARELHIWVPANTSISCAIVSGADGKQQRKAVLNESTNLAIVDINDLAAGVYHLTVQTNKGETLQLKFTRQ